MSPPVAQLLCFPSNDTDFADFAAQALEQTEDRSMRGFEAQMRSRYPQVRVSRRDLAGETGETWYVYRDGRL